MSGGLDHGMLNVPLIRRGCIDRQIDAHKAAVAKEAVKRTQALRNDVRAKRARIHHILDSLPDDRVLAIAQPLGSRKAATARTALKRAASYNLDRWLTALEREVGP